MNNNLNAATILTDLATDTSQLKMVSNKGYTIAPQKILRCYRVTDFEKVLLIDLVSYMGDNGYAFPSHGHLAFKHGKKSTASVKTALKSLRDKGFIKWHTGGGDLGTNHYRLKELYFNPYLILSEFTQYCVNEILNRYRGEISYDSLFSSVLNFSQKNQNSLVEDIYGKFIDLILKKPAVRNSHQHYHLFADNLTYYIEDCTNFLINIDWYSHVKSFFETNFPDVPLNIEVNEDFYESIGNPYDKVPIQIRIEGFEEEDYKKLNDYRRQLKEHVYKFNEEKLWASIARGVEAGELDVFSSFDEEDKYYELLQLKKDTLPLIKRNVGNPFEFAISLKIDEFIQETQFKKQTTPL